MSSLNTIISQINSLTGYNLPTASNSYIISSSMPLSSGSVNDIVAQINRLTGYNIPATSVTVTTSSIEAGGPVVIYAPTPVSGTIPTTGIRPGAIIEAEHLLRIINALNGVNPNLIVMSGSLYVSGSATFAQDLILPFVPNENFIESVSGSMEGTDTVNGGSF
jgi:hypothetical protein